MGSVPAIIKSRWQAQVLVGQAKHQLIVRIREGRIHRSYQALEMLDDYSPEGVPNIWLGNNITPWQGQWQPYGDWETLPNIESAKTVKDTSSNNGTSTATVIMDDIAFVNTTGAAGLFRKIERGYYSPQRGVIVNTRPQLWSANEWKDRLNGGYQVELWEGYGPDNDPTTTPLPDPTNTYAWSGGEWVQTAVGGGNGTCVPPNAAISRTFTGLIDGCDIDSHPDTITITARDFGILLTDQRLIFKNKDPAVPSPVIFADQGRVLGEVQSGSGGNASGSYGSYDPSGITNVTGDASGWLSAIYDTPTPASMPWVEITLPAGTYDNFYIATESPGQAIYACLRPDSTEGDSSATWNGSPVSWGDWIEGTAVPGASGVYYVKYIPTLATGGVELSLGGELIVPGTATLRLYVDNLNAYSFDANGNQIALPGFAANILRFFAYAFGTSAANSPVPISAAYGADFKAQGWVLIDDVADIARMLFVWAGFKEWDVDNFTWSLEQPFVFGQDQYFMDVLNSVMNQAAYMFYMEAPTDNDMSIGVPCFKKQRVGNTATSGGSYSPNPPISLTVRDTDMLEAIDANWDMSNLPGVIRIRGAIDSTGVTFGRDLSKRYQATYWPPWSGGDYLPVSPSAALDAYSDPAERISGLGRHYVQTQGQVISLSLNSVAECMFAAVMTAVQFALAEVTSTFQISGIPGLELNTAIVVIDSASGTNSRIWVTSIESDHNLGEEGSWHMTIQGVLLDTQDMAILANDFAYCLFQYAMIRRA